MQMLSRKACVVLMALGFLLIGSAGHLWALNDDYNRPMPRMDYAPQEIGMDDRRYDELSEADCRACHGQSLANRHHVTPIVLEQHTCSIDSGGCHEVLPEPPGVVVIQDCTTSGCHSWDDVYAYGWHHNTDLSAPENCVSCHNPNLVAEIHPFISFQEYPPSVVTPTPFSCENCHWEQGVVQSGWTEGDPPPPEPDAGHPSTYDHYDPWGNFLGYHEYGRPILGNFDTHHMGFKGNVAAQCWKCHCNDPYPPIWDPYNPELIRYCEICHDVVSLHTIFPHVGPPGTGGSIAVYGWEATGFHAGGEGTDPTEYGPFLQTAMCLSCHGDAVPPVPGSLFYKPTIRIKPQGITPNAACPTGLVNLEGENFGESQAEGMRVEMKTKNDPLWIKMPVYLWSDDQIFFEVPCVPPGNYRVRVGGSNQVGFTVMDCGPCNYTIPEWGPCNPGAITLLNGTGQFGPSQDTISAPGATDGIYRTIQVTSTQGDYVSLIYSSWTNNEVKFRFRDFFQDLDGDFLQDGDEPTISSCEGMDLGIWSIYIKYIFHSDDDLSGNYTQGDTVSQIETSMWHYFELTDSPFIAKVKPVGGIRAGESFRIIGANFGNLQTTSEVYIGNKNQYNPTRCYGKNCYGGSPTGGKLQTVVKEWSDSKLKVKAGFNQSKWAGKKRYVWVVKDGVVSNAKKVSIVAP